MPIYEYECIKCNERFELRRSMRDDDRDVKCPQCGTDNPRRIISAISSASGGKSCITSSST